MGGTTACEITCMYNHRRPHRQSSCDCPHGRALERAPQLLHHSCSTTCTTTESPAAPLSMRINAAASRHQHKRCGCRHLDARPAHARQPAHCGATSRHFAPALTATAAVPPGFEGLHASAAANRGCASGANAWDEARP